MCKLNMEENLTGRSVRRAPPFFIGWLMLVCATGLITSIWALTSVKMQAGQSNPAKHQQSAILNNQGTEGDENDNGGEDHDHEIGGQDEDDGCGGRGGPAVRLPSTKLFIEHNATDGDTGVHGAFDGIDWQKLCVFDPNGKRVLEVEPKRQLRHLSMSGIFFESREPPNEEVPIEQILARFPEGLYSVRGRALDGRRLTGEATFTHDIPAAPVIEFPQEGGVVSSAGFTVMWNHVETTLDGKPLNRTGYEVIITKEVPDDPHGFSRPTFDVHVPPSETSLAVPSEFLEPGTAYELEVLVLEVSGNQTITVLFFETE